MPHCSPMMKIRPQITIVEDRISRPACRRPSPKKRKTFSVKTSMTIREQKRTISPIEASQSRGTASQESPITRASPTRADLLCARSLDLHDLGVGGQEGLREHVVEREHAERRDHDRLVDGSTDALGAAGRGHPLVT